MPSAESAASKQQAQFGGHLRVAPVTSMSYGPAYGTGGRQVGRGIRGGAGTGAGDGGGVGVNRGAGSVHGVGGAGVRSDLAGGSQVGTGGTGSMSTEGRPSRNSRTFCGRWSTRMLIAQRIASLVTWLTAGLSVRGGTRSTPLARSDAGAGIWPVSTWYSVAARAYTSVQG